MLFANAEGPILWLGAKLTMTWGNGDVCRTSSLEPGASPSCDDLRTNILRSG